MFFWTDEMHGVRAEKEAGREIVGKGKKGVGEKRDQKKG